MFVLPLPLQPLLPLPSLPLTGVRTINRSENLWNGLKEQELQPERLMNCTGQEAAIMVEEYLGTRWCGRSIVLLADIYYLFQIRALEMLGSNVGETIL